MERVIQKMAQKLSEYDESSLMQLWHSYAVQVLEFEPTKKWEEAALALCLIQAVRWKNQLFNYNLATESEHMPEKEREGSPDFASFFPYDDESTFSTDLASADDEPASSHKPHQKNKAIILAFPQHPIRK